MLRALANRLRRIWRAEEGFTLMELMVVVIIIGILATGGVVAYNSFIQRAVQAAADTTASTLATAVRMYEIENGISLADKSKNEIVDVLKDYVASGITLEVLFPEENLPTSPTEDKVWLRCPGDATDDWEVIVWRSNRFSDAAKFKGEEAPDPQANGSCANS